MTGSRWWGRRGALGLVGLGIMINLATFAMTDASASEHWKALLRFDSADMVQIAVDTQPSMQSRYGLAVALGFVAPDSTVDVVTDSFSTSARPNQLLLGFGRAHDLRLWKGDALTVPGDVDFTPYIVASGPGGRLGDPWFIALAPRPDGERRTLLVVTWLSPVDGFTVRTGLVDEALLPAEFVAAVEELDRW